VFPLRAAPARVFRAGVARFAFGPFWFLGGGAQNGGIRQVFAKVFGEAGRAWRGVGAS
jgi:hypothetical protein